MKLLNDHWTYKIEALGYGSFAAQLCKVLLKANMPTAITISGRWGAGKTSMLRYVMSALGGEPSTSLSILGTKTKDKVDDFKLGEELKDLKAADLKQAWTVWFNPWQYQNEENPVIPLLHEIRNQIKGSEKFKRWLKDKDASRDAIEAGFYTLGSLIDDAINFSLGRKVVGSGNKFFEQMEDRDVKRKQKRFTEPVNAQLFYLEFEKAVGQIVGEKGRLIVFIDDLDRCSNQTVFSLLESIKLYLSCHQCLFVFGLDRIHIESALQQAAGYNMDEARQYIEKLFQACFYLPRPQSGYLHEFIKQCLTILEIEGDKEKLTGQLIKWLPENPRVIKTALNGLALYKSMLSEPLCEDEKWLLVHLFRVFYPDVYELLQKNPTDTFLKIKKISGGEIDYADQQLAYIYYILENPIKFSPQSQEDTNNVNSKAEQMDESRFRQIRANAWQAETLHAFQNAFIDAFTDNPESLKDYLI
jgi:hypothetical protein